MKGSTQEPKAKALLTGLVAIGVAMVLLSLLGESAWTRPYTRLRLEKNVPSADGRSSIRLQRMVSLHQPGKRKTAPFCSWVRLHLRHCAGPRGSSAATGPQPRVKVDKGSPIRFRSGLDHRGRTLVLLSAGSEPGFPLGSGVPWRRHDSHSSRRPPARTRCDSCLPLEEAATPSIRCISDCTGRPVSLRVTPQRVVRYLARPGDACNIDFSPSASDAWTIQFPIRTTPLAAQNHSPAPALDHLLCKSKLAIPKTGAPWTRGITLESLFIFPITRNSN